jgi:hypothetical protein
MKNYTKFEHLTKYGETLRENGFTIIAPKNSEYTWFWATKNNRFIAVDANKFGQFNISTKHKPSMTHGTGFGVCERITTPTLENAELALNKPAWTHRYKGVDEYVSIEEFMIGHKWCEPYIVIDEPVKA